MRKMNIENLSQSQWGIGKRKERHRKMEFVADAVRASELLPLYQPLR